MKTLGSNFTTRIGLGLLLVLVLVCAYFGLTVAGIFLGGLLLLCLAAYLWAAFSLRKIRIRFGGEDACAFPGEELSVSAELSNRKFLPLLWLDLTFPTKDSPCIAPLDDTEEEVTETFTWILPHQTLRWRQNARAVRRGVCPVEKLLLRSGDGFGLSEQISETAPDGTFRFVVYPKVYPVDVMPVLRNMRELEKAKNGFTVDKTLLNSTRPYREGDSFKDINWRLLARTDEVQVNVHETLDVRRVCFVPDLGSFTYIERQEHDGTMEIIEHLREDAMERMLSVIASLIVGINDRDVLCSLVIPGYGETQPRFVIPETSDGQVMLLLSALAEIDYRGGKTAMPTDDMLEEHHKLGQIYLFSWDPKCAAGAAEPERYDPLGVIRVLSRCEEEERGDQTIFKESDFLMI